MGEKLYAIDLDEFNKIYAYIKTVRGSVNAFVVKLLCTIDDKEVEVLRFDSGHGIPHIDYLNVKGEVVQKRWLRYLTDEQLYRERFIRWQGKERKKSSRRTRSAGR